MKYRIKNGQRAASATEAGTIVYTCKGHDYGLSNDDTLMTGIRHISVTLDENGEYPFFTIPEEDLEPLAE